MLERGVWIFWIFFLFFSEFSIPDRVLTEFGTKFFFFLFLGLSHPVLARNNAKMMFFNFWIFLLFFKEFSCRGRVRTEFWTNFFFFSFLAYIIPFSLKIMLERGFLIFFFFFHNFFGIFLAGLSKNGIRD